MTDYIQYIPQPLLRDIIANRTIPFIGSGFSMNAKLNPGEKMLMWKDLGDSFSKEIEGLCESQPIESFSCFEHKYGRTLLLEKMKDDLLIGSAKPDKAHLSFCDLPFETVCTTNFDFLLEEGYHARNKKYNVIAEDSLLSITSDSNTVDLVKFHGDFNHPLSMVVTEDDYDSYLDTHPLTATYICNLLITKTPLFIGYSLDDADFRQIYNVVKSRLNKLTRKAYVIKINASLAEVERYRRRGVEVINIPGDPAKDYPVILPALFDQIKEKWTRKMTIPLCNGSSINADIDDSIPNNSICLFLCDKKSLSEYKTEVFKVLRGNGMTPVEPSDLTKENYTAHLMALMNRAKYIFVDTDSEVEIPDEFSLKMDGQRTYVCISKDQSDKTKLRRGVKFIHKKYEHDLLDIDALIKAVIEIVDNSTDYQLLLEKGFNQAAFISAYSIMEKTVRDYCEQTVDNREKGYYSMIPLLRDLKEKSIISSDIYHDLFKAVRLRNEVVHYNSAIDHETAVQYVNKFEELVNLINSKSS